MIQISPKIIVKTITQTPTILPILNCALAVADSSKVYFVISLFIFDLIFIIMMMEE